MSELEFAANDNQYSLIELTADVVSSYVSNNPVPAAELPGLIGSIHSALSNLSSPAAGPEEKRAPAVPIKKSITDDFLICLDDGKKFKSLKRHLTILGMSPDEYRAKWGLPADYPMVAPGYAATRSQLAIASGLGRRIAVVSPEKAAPKARKAR